MDLRQELIILSLSDFNGLLYNIRTNVVDVKKLEGIACSGFVICL